MKITKTMISTVLVAEVLMVSSAYAGTQFGEAVTLTGFGTVGVTSADTDKAQYRSDIFQPRGASSKPDFGIDSRLGLQLNASVNDAFSMVSQVVVRRNLPSDVSLEWLYGEIKLTRDMSFKAGRVLLPAFMISDSRAVGYSAYWVRAPQEVYALYALTYVDGGQLMYRSALGGVNITTQLTGGKLKKDFLFGGVQGTFDGSNARSINLTAESGDWLWRIGQTSADFRIDALGIPNITDKFSGVGVQYDNGTAIVMSEYVKRRQSGPPGDLLGSNSWYVSGGWRMKGWTPYVSLSRYTPTGYGITDRRKDETVALGARWDVMQNVALKAQVQGTKSSYGFVNATPQFVAEHPSVKVFSMVLEFVF